MGGAGRTRWQFRVVLGWCTAESPPIPEVETWVYEPSTLKFIHAALALVVCPLAQVDPQQGLDVDNNQPAHPRGAVKRDRQPIVLSFGSRSRRCG